MTLRKALMMLAAVAIPVATPAAAPTPPPVPMLGVAWYPEQWPEGRWDADLTLMAQAGIRFVRIGEFAWSTLEPREDDYQLDWLARAVRAAERHHIAVVIGTPTAAPPAWLTTKYPEVLRTLPDGARAEHGGRHQASYISERYAVLARGIVEKLGDRFGHDPDVIGWQIDNEIGTGDYGAETRAGFQAWLKARWGTLAALNTAWTTAYWSQTYQDWNQISIPLPGADANPGLMLAFREFTTDAYRAYLANQTDALRARIDPAQKLTTNYYIDARAKTSATFSPESDDLDFNIVTNVLDVAAWDEYPEDERFDPVRFGMTHDGVRGLLQRNFWVMETRPGSADWSNKNNPLDPSEMRALAWHAIGHGADALAYWQWRAALNGQEQLYQVVVGPDGTPAPAYPEIAKIGADFKRAAPALAGTGIVAHVAILDDYKSRWAIGWQRTADDYFVSDAMLRWYGPLHARTGAVDVVAASVSLNHYNLVAAPALNVLTPEVAKRLEAYVRGGGNLVLGPRSGVKDAANALWSQRQPGPLVSLLGARVGQYYPLKKSVPVAGVWVRGTATVWAERIEPLAPDVHVMLRYGGAPGSWLAGQPAAVTRRVGAGSITYVGAELSQSLMQAITTRLARSAGVETVWPKLPVDIDLAVREGGGRRVFVLINFGHIRRRIALPAPMQDVLTGEHVTAVSLPHYGVAVLSASRTQTTTGVAKRKDSMI